MNKFFTICGIILMLTFICSAQSKNKRKVVPKVPVWEFFQTDQEDQSIYLKTRSITRYKDTVVFQLRYDKRGTSVFSTIVANCTSDIFEQIDVFAKYPNKKELVPLFQNVNPTYVIKGTSGYDVLNEVCK